MEKGSSLNVDSCYAISVSAEINGLQCCLMPNDGRDIDMGIDLITFTAANVSILLQGETDCFSSYLLTFFVEGMFIFMLFLCVNFHIIFAIFLFGQLTAVIKFFLT